METNNRLNIRLMVKIAGQPFDIRFLDADELFDKEYLSKEDDGKADCDTPWKFDDLNQLAAEMLGVPGSRIESVELDVFHRPSGEHRRVIQQSWSGHSIRVDWKTSPFCEPTCLMSMTLREESSQTEQFVKIKLWPSDFAILSHSRLNIGDSTKEATPEFVHGYERKRPLGS